MISKISIGTVQFGMDYGIANKIGKTSFSEASKILDEASKLGINKIDTASVYGNSEIVLGKIGVDKFKVTTKIPSVPKDTKDIYNFVEKTILKSLSNIAVDSFYEILIHDSNQLLNKAFSDEMTYAMQKLKEKGYAQKIGISIYEPLELENINNLSNYDVIQSPLNILDRRLIETGWLLKLKKYNIDIQVRSIFLQGLLLMGKESRPEKFNRWSSIWRIWDQWLTKNKLTPLKACINFPFSIDGIDSVVIGVDSKSQLQEINNNLTNRNIRYPSALQSEEKDLINPIFWNHL
jgi:aryl-alcohol dehydrogenase-like predicted oxidoreductase